MRPVERILYIRTDRIGDTLMNLPALRALRQSYPKAWLALLTDRKVAELFRGHPDLDEVIAVDAAELAGSAARRDTLVREMRKARFDIGIASNPSKFFHWLLFAAGVPVRAGWRRKWAFFLNRTLSDKKDRAGRHEIDSNLDLVALVAPKKWDGALRLAEDPAAAERVRAMLKPLDPSLPVVAVHAGTSNPRKKWPVERFTELCRLLLSSKKSQLVLIGGEEERESSRSIAEKIPQGPWVDLTGRLTLAELAAFFRHPQVKTLVSSDSGPVHVAWMSGKPAVVFYAKDAVGSDPVRWGPRDGKSEVLFKNMDEIAVGEVWERVQRFL